jgi:hypothetical protein
MGMCLNRLGSRAFREGGLRRRCTVLKEVPGQWGIKMPVYSFGWYPNTVLYAAGGVVVHGEELRDGTVDTRAYADPVQEFRFGEERTLVAFERADWVFGVVFYVMDGYLIAVSRSGRYRLTVVV